MLVPTLAYRSWCSDWKNYGWGVQSGTTAGAAAGRGQCLLAYHCGPTQQGNAGLW